jgi:hypothetical protein
MTNDERAAIRARCDAIGRRYATVDEQCSHVGEADAAVWTVSADPYEAGWETDSGYPGYGLLRSEAEFYAAAPATLLAALDEIARLRAEVERLNDENGRLRADAVAGGEP